MTRINCNRGRCLNNKYGICTADTIEYEEICQTYITPHMTKHTKVIVDYALVLMADLRETAVMY